MGIEDVLFEFRMSGDVDLRDALGWHAVHVREWIEVMIARTCVCRPSTLPQQRWSESHGVFVRFTSCFNRRRCSGLGFSAEPKYIQTPCCTTLY